MPVLITVVTSQVNLHCPWEYDIGWNDQWTFPLFTRGGPYWQYVKVIDKKHVNLSYLIAFLLQIPFSKFVYTSKGWIQDRQRRVELDRLTKISITLADKYVSKLEPGQRLCVSLTIFFLPSGSTGRSAWRWARSGSTGRGGGRRTSDTRTTTCPTRGSTRPEEYLFGSCNVKNPFIHPEQEIIQS